LNRSLTGLSAQVCHLQFFQSRNTFLTGRRSVTCLFLSRCNFFSLSRSNFFSVASPLPCQRASIFFFFSDRSFTLLGAPLFFVCLCVRHAFFSPVQSLPWRADHFFSFFFAAAQRAIFLFGRFLQGSAVSGHFPGARTVFVFLLAVALQTAASVSAISLCGHLPGTQIFCLLPLSRTAGPVRAKTFFVWSPVWCACRIFFLHAASGHFPSCRARRFFVLLALHEDMRVENLLFGQQQGCACRFFLFVLSGHLFSAQRA
jgi:hypothetical protein